MTITLQQARQQVTTSDYYALGYLNLCAVSYADEGGSASTIEQLIAKTVPTIPTYPDGGSWTFQWVGITSDRGTLLYVATYGTGDGPIFNAVCVRGTDIKVWGEGLFGQLRDDLEAHCQYEWPSGNQCVYPAPANMPMVAKGSADLLTTLTTQCLDSSGKTLMDFLPNFLSSATNQDAPLVVTGHSLGGAGTMVLALYLQSNLSPAPTIVTSTFAAPTPGNSDFVALYEKTFPWCSRWYNTNDLIPFAFDNVAGMQSLWTSCNLAPPGWASSGINDLENDIQGRNYAQQSAQWSRGVTQSCEPIPVGGKQPDWLSNLLYEHSLITAYYPAMTTPLYKGVYQVDLVSVPTST